MPRATTSAETERFPLKTAPPDGFVVLRRLNYGERKRVEGMSMKFHMSDEAQPGDAETEGESEGPRSGSASIDLAAVVHFQFARSIVDHNLEDESGRKLDFKNPADFDKLDDAVGEEVEELIVRFSQPKPVDKAPKGETPLGSASGTLSSEGSPPTPK